MGFLYLDVTLDRLCLFLPFPQVATFSRSTTGPGWGTFRWADERGSGMVAREVRERPRQHSKTAEPILIDSARPGGLAARPAVGPEGAVRRPGRPDRSGRGRLAAVHVRRPADRAPGRRRDRAPAHA